MAHTIRPGWSKPATILFASEIPANEKVLAFAVAHAREFGARLILFHAYDTMIAAATDAAAGITYYDRGAVEQCEFEQLAPVAARVRAQGVPCEIVVREGLAADQILRYVHEHQVDRVIMGTHSPGALNKVLVGSVAEAVLRRSCAPVYIIGPETVDARYRNYATNTILCAVSMREASPAAVELAAQIALEHDARLILERIVKPQERSEVLAGRNFDELEAELLALVPANIRRHILVNAVVVPGDPTEELLFQARAQNADLIVMSAQGASAFAAVARHGVVYKVTSRAHCPVLTLSPTLLAECGVHFNKHHHASEIFLAGVF